MTTDPERIEAMSKFFEGVSTERIKIAGTYKRLDELSRNILELMSLLRSKFSASSTTY